MENKFKHKQSIRSEERNGYFFEFDEYDRNTYYMTPSGYWNYNFFNEPVNGRANPVPYKSIHKYWTYYNNINLDMDKLCGFGKLETFEEKEDKFYVLITKGFNTNAKNTMNLMNLLLNSVGKKYPSIHKYITDDNHFELILKKDN